MQEASAGLANTVLPALEKLTHPQLNTEWFVGAYQVTFALAVFFWVALLAWNFFLLARRRISGDDVFDTLVYYTPLFFVGSTFGPALGVFVLSFIGALNDSLVQWGIVGSVQATTSKLQAAIAAGSPGSIVGGSLVAIILFAAMIVALLLTFIVLLVMLVTLYLTGAVFPMSLVWVNHPRRRGRGLKILYVWVGVLFSHVLVFFLLGLAFRMVAGMSLDVGGGALQALTNIAIAVIVLLMATLSPVALAAFAPIGPTDSGGAGGITAPSGGGRRSGFSGVESEDDSQLAQLTRSSEGVSTPTDGDDDDRSNGQGRLMTRVRQMQAEGTGKAPSSTSIEGGAATPSAAAPDGVAGAPGTSSPGLTQPVPATAGVGGGGGGGTPTGLPVGGPAGSGPASGGPAGGGPAIGAAARGAPGAGAGAGEAASAVGAGGAAGAAGEGVAAAGAGAAATGIGAPVGAVLIGAGIAVGKAVEVAQEAGDIAAEHMDHRQEDHDADPHPRW